VVIGDPAFADYADGMDPLMPDWFDDAFIQAIVDVAAEIPDPRRRYDHRPASKAKELAQRLREAQPV
jgi:hypothetical protein